MTNDTSISRAQNEGAYTVTSDSFAGGQIGDVLSEEALDGCNIPALIEAGHLTALNPSEANSATTIKEQ